MGSFEPWNKYFCVDGLHHDITNFGGPRATLWTPYSWNGFSGSHSFNQLSPRPGYDPKALGEVPLPHDWQDPNFNHRGGRGRGWTNGNGNGEDDRGCLWRHGCSWMMLGCVFNMYYHSSFVQYTYTVYNIYIYIIINNNIIIIVIIMIYFKLYSCIYIYIHMYTFVCICWCSCMYIYI